MALLVDEIYYITYLMKKKFRLFLALIETFEGVLGSIPQGGASWPTPRWEPLI